MAISVRLLQRLRQLIADAHSAFVINYISPTAVPPDVLERLRRLGMVKPKVRSLDQAYLLGRLIQVAAAQKQAAAEKKPVKPLSGVTVGAKPGPGVSVPVLKDAQGKQITLASLQDSLRANPIPLTTVERHALDIQATQMGQYIVGLGNRVEQQTGNLLIEADKTLDRNFRQTVQNLVQRNIARRETVAQLKSDLGHSVGDWSRDLSRLAITEKHNAMEQGFAESLRQSEGSDARVAKLVSRNACDHCRKAYLNDEGNPKVFKLIDLQSNGTNFQKKARDWLPVLGPLHPNCFMGDTQVLTSSGYRPIKCIMPGTYVLTHKGRWREVTHSWRTPFDGNLRRVVSNNGNNVVCTPNHLFFTADGWVAANRLKIDHHVFGDLNAAQINRLMDLFVDPVSLDRPTFRSQKFGFAHVCDNLFLAGVPISSVNFYGQSLFRKSEVYQVMSHLVIRVHGYARVGQQFVNSALIGSLDLSCLSPAGQGDGFRFSNSSSGGNVSGHGEAFSFAKGHVSISCDEILTHSPLLSSGLANASDDFGSGYTESFRNSFDGDLFDEVPAQDHLGVEGRSAKYLNSASSASTSQVVNSDAHFCSDALHGNTADHVFDLDIVNRDRLKFHVASGWDEIPLHRLSHPVFRHPELIGDGLKGEHLAKVEISEDRFAHFGRANPRRPQMPGSQLPSNQVAHVSSVPFSGDVYNLSVDEDESYIAQGFAVHNCLCTLVSVPDGAMPVAGGKFVYPSSKKSVSVKLRLNKSIS